MEESPGRQEEGYGRKCLKPINYHQDVISHFHQFSFSAAALGLHLCTKLFETWYIIWQRLSAIKI